MDSERFTIATDANATKWVDCKWCKEPRRYPVIECSDGTIIPCSKNYDGVSPPHRVYRELVDSDDPAIVSALAIAKAAREAGLVEDGKLDQRILTVAALILKSFEHARYCHSLQEWVLDIRHIHLIPDAVIREKILGLLGEAERRDNAAEAAAKGT